MGREFVFFILWIVFAILLGVLADRKNRSVIGWALIGGLFAVPALLILAFLPPLCRKCHNRLSVAEWKACKCPHCEKAEGNEHAGEHESQQIAKRATLPWIFAFIGIAIGLLGGVGNVPQLGFAALFGPAIFCGLLGLAIGYIIHVVMRSVRKKKE